MTIAEFEKFSYLGPDAALVRRVHKKFLILAVLRMLPPVSNPPKSLLSPGPAHVQLVCIPIGLHTTLFTLARLAQKKKHAPTGKGPPVHNLWQTRRCRCPLLGPLPIAAGGGTRPLQATRPCCITCHGLESSGR